MDNSELILLLLALGANANATNTNVRTALHILVAKALVEDADSVCFRQPDMSGRPSNLITELIRRGASLDVMD